MTCPLFLRMQAMGRQAPASKQGMGARPRSSKNSEREQPAWPKRYSIGDDVILACGEKGNCDGRVWHSLDMLRNCN